MTEPATSPTAIPTPATAYVVSDLDTRDLYWPEQMMTRCDADSSERYAVKWDSLHGTLKLCQHHSLAFATKLHAHGWHVTSPSL